MAIRRLPSNEEVEFPEPTSVSVAFLERETYTFNKVVKALKDNDGTLYLEFEDSSFAEIKSPYKFFQIGSEAPEHD